jgi:hypothetical protein
MCTWLHPTPKPMDGPRCLHQATALSWHLHCKVCLGHLGTFPSEGRARFLQTETETGTVSSYHNCFTVPLSHAPFTLSCLAGICTARCVLTAFPSEGRARLQTETETETGSSYHSCFTVPLSHAPFTLSCLAGICTARCVESQLHHPPTHSLTHHSRCRAQLATVLQGALSYHNCITCPLSHVSRAARVHDSH